MSEDPPRKWITNNELQLEIKALRSDVKLWILAAVALNQFLASVDLPSTVTGTAVLALLLKGFISVVFAGRA